jgi:hypothetical protein
MVRGRSKYYIHVAHFPGLRPSLRPFDARLAWLNQSAEQTHPAYYMFLCWVSNRIASADVARREHVFLLHSRMACASTRAATEVRMQRKWIPSVATRRGGLSSESFRNASLSIGRRVA